MWIFSRLKNIYGSFRNKAYLLELLHFPVIAAFTTPLPYSFTTNKNILWPEKFFLKIEQILQSILVFAFQKVRLEKNKFQEL